MLVGNKTGNTARKNKILEFAHRKGFAVLGFVPFDRAVADAGVSGSTVSALKGSTALRAIGRLSETIITCITQIKKE
jgi:CO dehydrogenase nickel-insertion accessory protein CooC1